MHSSKRVVARGDTGDRPAFHDSSSRSAAVVQAEKASAVERDDPRGIHHGGRRLSGHVGAADVLACPMSLEPGAENTDRQMALRELAQAQIRRECRRWDFDWDAFVADCPEWGITEVVHRRAVQQEREAHARFPVGPLRHLELSRLHHRPGGGNPGTGGRPSAPRRDRERHPRPQVRRGAQPSPLGPLPRQRRLAGGAGDRPQPGTLDGAHRSGRADRDHQDPATPLLFHGRKAHPLGAPPHFASAPALALGNPVQWRPR